MPDQNPLVTFTMENGDQFKAELYPEQAPNTVNNFVSLIQKGYYNGLIFHRVIPGFMIQGGCPQGSGVGGPGYCIPQEFLRDAADPESFLAHDKGVLSMARTADPDSGGSQFFVMTDRSPHLDRQYSAFGQVVEGIEAVDRIVSQPSDHNDRPEADQRMATLVVETFGTDYPEPETI